MGLPPRVELAIRGGAVRLTSVADGPAAQAGVQQGDILLTIDGAPMTGLSLDRVIDKVRGRPGSLAALSLARAAHDGPLDLTVVRKEIRLRPLLRVAARDDGLWVEAIGRRRMFELRPNQPVRLVPLSQTEFSISGRYGNRIGFLMNHGKATVAVLNPGRWAQRGLRTD